MPEALTTFPLSDQDRAREVCREHGFVDTPSETLVTCSDLAAWLQVSERTVRRMVALGTIGPTAFKVRGGVRWRRETITQWLIESERHGELINRREWEIMEVNREVGRPSPKLAIHGPRIEKDR
jgi:Helix-turn-helix domain